MTYFAVFCKSTVATAHANDALPATCKDCVCCEEMLHKHNHVHLELIRFPKTENQVNKT